MYAVFHIHLVHMMLYQGNYSFIQVSKRPRPFNSRIAAVFACFGAVFRQLYYRQITPSFVSLRDLDQTDVIDVDMIACLDSRIRLCAVSGIQPQQKDQMNTCIGPAVHGEGVAEALHFAS